MEVVVASYGLCRSTIGDTSEQNESTTGSIRPFATGYFTVLYLYGCAKCAARFARIWRPAHHRDAAARASSLHEYRACVIAHR